jgi:hypothetical protein
MVLLMGLMGLLILRDGWRSYKIHTYNPEAAQQERKDAKADASSDRSAVQQTNAVEKADVSEVAD